MPFPVWKWIRLQIAMRTQWGLWGRPGICWFELDVFVPVKVSWPKSNKLMLSSTSSSTWTRFIYLPFDIDGFLTWADPPKMKHGAVQVRIPNQSRCQQWKSCWVFGSRATSDEMEFCETVGIVGYLSSRDDRAQPLWPILPNSVQKLCLFFLPIIVKYDSIFQSKSFIQWVWWKMSI